MSKKIVAFVLLCFLATLYVPDLYFMLFEQEALSSIDYDVIIDEKVEIIDVLKFMEKTDYKALLAVEKNDLSNEAYNSLLFELSTLKKLNLIGPIALSNLKEQLIYTAYHHYGDENYYIGIIEYRFSDYNSYEYTFWVDADTGRIYELSIINKDFVNISEEDFKLGIQSYYDLDDVSLQDYEPYVWQFDLNLDEALFKAYYLEFSIYNGGNGKFVPLNSGMNWSVFSKSLE